MTELSKRRTLAAGAARAIITPPLEIRMLGYTVQECLAESVERELTATALVLTDGVNKVAILACDLVFVQSPHVDRIRARIGARLAIPAEHVLVSCSHTHLGPMLPGWHQDLPEQAALQQRYLEHLEDVLAGVAASANAQLQPARIGAGAGSAPLGMNRREKLPDGRVVIGENPAGPVDRDVSVVRIDDFKGRTIATIYSSAAHTVVLGPKTSQLSPDYVGPAREIIESRTGGLSLFMLGAAGNVNPICGIGSGGPEQYDDLARLGAILGGEVVTTWARIRTHNEHGPRRIVQSVAAVSVWDYEPAPEATIEHFDVAARRLVLPLARLPERAAAERQLSEYRSKLTAAQVAGGRGAIHVAQRLVHWAELVVKTIDAGENPPTLPLEFWALRINDIGLVAVSGEPFAELGLEVKRRSPLRHTLFIGYSNGCIGYLPTPEAFGEGGMEVHESTQNYLLPCHLTDQWGPTVVETSLEMLGSLK